MSVWLYVIIPNITFLNVTFPNVKIPIRALKLRKNPKFLPNSGLEVAPDRQCSLLGKGTKLGEGERD
jgi:hypothetical protein